MGGTPSLIPRLPHEVAESSYASVLQKLGIDGLPTEQRIERLKKTDREDWVKKLGPGFALSPVADEHENKPPFYRADVPEDMSSPPGSKWCTRIMLGDCEIDVSFKTAVDSQ